MFQEQYVAFAIVEPISESVFAQYHIQATPQTMIILEDGTIGAVWYGPLSNEAMAQTAGLLKQPFVERR